MSDFQTVAFRKNFIGLTFTITFGLYLLFGIGYVDGSVAIFFGPFNLEIKKVQSETRTVQGG